MEPKTEQYIEDFLLGQFPSEQDRPNKEDIQKFVKLSSCDKIMTTAHQSLLAEWNSFKPKSELWEPERFDDSPPPPLPPCALASPHTPAPAQGAADVHNPVKSASVGHQQSPSPSHGKSTTTTQAPAQPRASVQALTQAVQNLHSPAVVPSPSVLPASPVKSPSLPAPVAQPKPPSAMIISFRLQNAKVGVPYANTIEVASPNVQDIAIVKVDGLADVGLQFDSGAMKVVGSPTKSGDFSFVVWFSKLGDSAQIPSKCNLTINPDPKSLWQNTPSDQEGLYAKPDEEKWLIKSPDHLLIGASKRGRSHAHTGIYRDDDFYIGHVKETAWEISVVSDGAGSCRYSRRGSEVICKEGGEQLHLLLSGDGGKKLTDAVADYKAAMDAGQPREAAEAAIRNALWTTIGYAVHHATKRIQEETTSRADLNAIMKDYSSTALFGITKKFSFGTLCAAYWVGDGAVAVLKADGTHVLLGEADGGEYSGQTRFLSPEFVKPEELAKRLRFALVPDFKALVLMTDGVSDPYFETDAGLNNADKWKALWDELEGAVELSKRGDNLDERMLSWLDFWSAGNHDDRTLSLIY